MGGVRAGVKLRTPRGVGTVSTPAFSRPPALGGTRAPHLPRLFASHHLRPSVSRAYSFPSNTWLLWSASSNFVYLLLGTLFLPPRLVLPTAQDFQTGNFSFRPPPLAVREERWLWGWGWVCATTKPSNLTPATSHHTNTRLFAHRQVEVIPHLARLLMQGTSAAKVHKQGRISFLFSQACTWTHPKLRSLGQV